MYILNTNVISEIRKSASGKADTNVLAWAKSVDAEDLYLSAITLSEIEIGVLSMERRDERQGAALRDWLENYIKIHFRDRILSIDAAVARENAAINVPDRTPTMDGLIAATAIANNMIVVTRNTGDFPWVKTINPWLYTGNSDKQL